MSNISLYLETKSCKDMFNVLFSAYEEYPIKIFEISCVYLVDMFTEYLLMAVILLIKFLSFLYHPFKKHLRYFDAN